MLDYYMERERSLMLQFFQTFSKHIHKYEFTSGNVFYDYTYTVKPNCASTFGEIKIRDFPIDKYDTYIIEAQKMNNLAKFVNKNYDVQYTNFFLNKNGTYDCIVFNIPYRVALYRKQGQENVIKKLWCNEKTYQSRVKKIEKDVVT